MESPQAVPMQDWLLNEWTEKLCLILESMADERPSIERLTAPEEELGPDPECAFWKQPFAGVRGAIVWIATPRSSALECGRRTLVAAGVESTEEGESVNTYSEILSQSLSALGQSIGAHLRTDTPAVDGEQLAAAPEGVEWIGACAIFGEQRLEPFWIAAGPALIERLTSGPAATSVETAAKSGAASTPLKTVQAETANSKTFDLLLEVGLPVSISFGRTFLPIKDVLKLTTGSIVELDRTVSEPVDVIVNNCVIARGEVVVIEGNYGVRISQIASRFDRLKTGRAAMEAQNAPVQ